MRGRGQRSCLHGDLGCQFEAIDEFSSQLWVPAAKQRTGLRSVVSAMAVRRESPAWVGDDGLFSAAFNGSRLLAPAVVLIEIL